MIFGSHFAIFYRRFVMVQCVFIMLALLACSVIPTFSSSSVRITDVAVSAGYNAEQREPIDVSNKFPNTIDRVFFSFYVTSNEPVIITLRWYQDGTLLHTQQVEQHNDWIVVWLRSTEPQFTPGQYKVEIVFATMMLSEHIFEVYEDDVP